MSDITSHLSRLLYFCPLCRGSTFSQHTMAEYSRDWNKCPSCGYMEEKTVSINRITNQLAPDKLTEPFVDPITPEIIEKVRSMTIGKTYSNSENNSCNDVKCPNCKSDV